MGNFETPLCGKKNNGHYNGHYSRSQGVGNKIFQYLI